VRLAAIVVATLVLAGCAGGVTSTVTLDAADQERAERIVLRLDDLPVGWRRQAEPPDSPPNHCVSDRITLMPSGEKGWEYFSMDEEPVSLSLSSAVYKNEDEARKVFNLVASEDMAQCYADYMRTNLADHNMRKNPGLDMKVTDVAFGPVYLRTGDESADYEVRTDIRTNWRNTYSGAFTSSSYLNVVSVRHDRAVVLVRFLDMRSRAFDEDEKRRLVEIVANRMEP